MEDREIDDSDDDDDENIFKIWLVLELTHRSKIVFILVNKKTKTSTQKTFQHHLIFDLIFLPIIRFAIFQHFNSIFLLKWIT